MNTTGKSCITDAEEEIEMIVPKIFNASRIFAELEVAKQVSIPEESDEFQLRM